MQLTDRLDERTRELLADGFDPILPGGTMQLTDRLDERTRELLADGFDAARARPVTLRANTLKATSDQISTALDAAGIGYARVPWYEDAFVLDGAREREVWDLDIYRDGLVYLQSLSSMLPPLILDPLTVMPACPGTKTPSYSMAHESARCGASTSTATVACTCRASPPCSRPSSSIRSGAPTSSTCVRPLAAKPPRSPPSRPTAHTSQPAK